MESQANFQNQTLPDPQYKLYLVLVQHQDHLQEYLLAEWLSQVFLEQH